MITPERLKQLLGKEIYYIFRDDYETGKVKVNKTYIDICDWYEDLFEEKEDAEFALKYQRIPRTDFLDLPTYEEMTSEEQWFTFSNSDLQEYGISYEVNEFVVYKIKRILNDVILKTFNVTKKDYFNACEYCKNLFLGGKE